jgi:hypothetical protein
MRQIRRGREERGKTRLEMGLVPQRTVDVAGEDELKTPRKGKSGWSECGECGKNGESGG